MKEIIPCLLIFLIGATLALGMMMMYSIIFSYWLEFDKYFMFPMICGLISMASYLIDIISQK